MAYGLLFLDLIVPLLVQISMVTVAGSAYATPEKPQEQDLVAVHHHWQWHWDLEWTGEWWHFDDANKYKGKQLVDSINKLIIITFDPDKH